ncbi:hypothetical protein C7212DRAFT_364575 [Tuber magnatum]|uniref:Aminoglycoside phosphotransferase domain-containing protein n=1 Tax=Tuber magnatum TaxID=42249 RepID=A0A317SPM5_9PEZI|nr:hypothetical protein C7212DRAFT_364575 [Tuber magnatum]
MSFGLGGKPQNLASLVSNELARVTESLTIPQFQSQRGTPVSGGANRNTCVHRLDLPPYFDTKYLLKSHHDTTTRDPAARTYTEVCGMVHARRAFDRHMPGSHLIPENYFSDFWNGALAMEFVSGEPLTWQVIGGWSSEQDRRFIRRLAVVRLVLLAQTMREIGAPTVGADGELAVGPMSGEIYFGEERRHYYPYYSRGPFKYASQFARAGLENEIQFFARRHNAGLFPQEPRRPDLEPDLGFPPNWPTWIDYLSSLLPLFPDGPGHNEAEDPRYHLTHGDLGSGNNMMIIGSKITSIIDWETASYAPYSESISDIPLEEGPECCFNPEDWTQYVNSTGDNQYFLTILSPYNESLNHRDDELDEQEDEPVRFGDKDLEPYILPVWALMQEYITRPDRSGGMLEFPAGIVGDGYAGQVGTDGDGGVLNAVAVIKVALTVEEQDGGVDIGGNGWENRRTLQSGKMSIIVSAGEPIDSNFGFTFGWSGCEMGLPMIVF